MLIVYLHTNALFDCHDERLANRLFAEGNIVRQSGLALMQNEAPPILDENNFREIPASSIAIRFLYKHYPFLAHSS